MYLNSVFLSGQRRKVLPPDARPESQGRRNQPQPMHSLPQPNHGQHTVNARPFVASKHGQRTVNARPTQTNAQPLVARNTAYAKPTLNPQAKPKHGRPIGAKPCRPTGRLIRPRNFNKGYNPIGGC